MKPIKRRTTTSMEGEHQVEKRNQPTKNFMPNYRTLKKKTLHHLFSRAVSHWLHLWHPYTWLVWNKIHLHNHPIANNNNDL
jgi:hypothetical protein